MEDVEKQIKEVENWMQQVRDEETGVEDYDFLDEAVTQGETLGNVGSYLAVYEEDGELVVDDELLEALDERKTEVEKEKSDSPPHIQERTNHREAVYGDLTGEERRKIRSGEYSIQELREKGETAEGLLDGSFNEQNSGHGFLKHMIEEFKQNADLDSSPSNNEDNKRVLNGGNDATQNPNPNRQNGGDNMSDYDHSRYVLAGTVAQHNDATTEIVHAAARLERKLGKVNALENVAQELEEAAIGDHRSVQSHLDSLMDNEYEAIENAIDQAYREISNVDIPDAPSDASANALDNATGYDKR